VDRACFAFAPEKKSAVAFRDEEQLSR